jgi:septation ring formation regulator EzrA
MERGIFDMVSDALLEAEGMVDGMSESEIKATLVHIRDTLDRLEQKLNKVARHAEDLRIWRAEVDARLRVGSQEFSELKAELETKINKTTVLAYLAGAAGSGAALMKLFGG